MSFFKDDKDKDSFFSPVSFNSATDSTSSWAFDSGSKKSENSFYDSGSNKSGFDAFSVTSNNASSSNFANSDNKSNGNFFSSPSDTKNSAFGGESNNSPFGTMGYNSHSKDQDVFSLSKQLEDNSRFGHWTPQDSYITAEVAKNNLEDKDWNQRFGGNSWAYESNKEDTKWAYSSAEKHETSWSLEIPSTKSSNWAFSSTTDQSSSWAYSQPSLNRWGVDSSSKDSSCDDFNPFSKKKE